MASPTKIIGALTKLGELAVAVKPISTFARTSEALPGISTALSRAVPASVEAPKVAAQVLKQPATVNPIAANSTEAKAAIKLWGNLMYGHYDDLPRGPGDLNAIRGDLKEYLGYSYEKDEGALYDLAEWFGDGASRGKVPRLTRELYDQMLEASAKPIDKPLTLYKSGDGKVPQGDGRWLSMTTQPTGYEHYGPTTSYVLPKGSFVIDTQGLADNNEVIVHSSKLPRSEKYAEGGAVRNPDQMTHKKSSHQDQSTQPLEGSALKALVRGWAAGTAGLPGDIEGLLRKADKYTTFNPDLRAMKNTDVALPTSDFYKEWLPGKQVGDENITAIGSLFGGAGATKPVSLARGALSRVAQSAPGPLAGTRAAMKGIIKAPGGNWLNGSVEDSLKGLKAPNYTHINDNGMAVAQDYGRPMTADELLTRGPQPPAVALNQFIDKQLTRYVKNDMATERDPIRALAERGTLHYAPNEELGWIPESLANRRQLAGASPDGSAVSNLAKQWEQRADTTVQAIPAGKYQKEVGPGWEANKWLDKTAPDVPVHSPMYSGNIRTSRELGFDHLIDELRNATNPNSGLPANLLLKPASLDRVSVPQAVEHVAKINAWREAQKVEANHAIANNTATVLHKEYADAATNPKGLRWVELKGDLSKDTKDAISDTYRPGYTALRDALKYEGDTMGHCVGGYCDDVANGSTRIFSLRDAKGQPHVTIEAAPMMNRDDPYAAAERIVQIKGKSNKKPNDEYLPFVQDFVRSGKWSDVGDLQNSGLVHRNQFPMINDADVPLPEGQIYFTPDEIKKFRPTDNMPQGYATGGSVTAGPWWDSYQEGPSDEQPTKTALPTLTLEDFRKRITPNMLDAEGKFKAPVAGVNYMLEGLTPEQAYNTAQGVTEWSDDNRLGKFNSRQQAEELLDPNWRAGPDNGGGGLGGFVRAVGNMGTGIAHNPALMAALTAGVGSSFNPAISEGLQSVGMSANAAKTAAPMVLNAGKTVLSGGSLADAARGAGASYLGGEMGSEVKELTGSDFLSKAANTATQSVVNGGKTGFSIDALATQYATGQLTDLSGLPPQIASLVVNLAKNKRVSTGSAIGALSSAVGSPKLSGFMSGA